MNLPDLPFDIIRRIIRTDGDSAPEMRFISKLWNTLSNQFLRRLKFAASLERVYLYAGNPEVLYREKKLETAKPRRHQIRMTSILPGRHGKCVGVGGWLRAFGNFQGGGVEVASESYKISDCLTIRLYFYLMGSIYILLGILCVALSIYNVPPHLIIALLCSWILLIIGIFLLCYVYDHDRNNSAVRAKFARFFAKFSRIETLVLENFDSERRSGHRSDAVQRTLGEIEINRLEIREYLLNDRLRNRILEMCRVHKIKHVFITVNDISIDFFQFVCDLSALGVKLDVYEKNISGGSVYFRKPKQFWIDMQSQLFTLQISMDIATIHDAVFNRASYKHRVKSHIRCDKFQGQFNQLSPVQTLRGWNYCWE